MGVFENFPYTNFHDLNLDWILRTMKDLDKEVREYIQNNKIQFADPIVWNIQSQYPANTLVTDPENNIVYLSRQAVPTGVALANTDYWQAVFTLQALWDAVDNVMESVAPINQHSNTQAEQQMEVNELFWLNHNLYIVTAQILRGQQIGSNNSRRVTIEEMLLQAQSYLTRRINNNTDNIEELQNGLTNETNRATSAESNIDSRISNIVSQAGTDNTEIVDARKGTNKLGGHVYNTLGDAIRDQITLSVNCYNITLTSGTAATLLPNKNLFYDMPNNVIWAGSFSQNFPSDYLNIPPITGTCTIISFAHNSSTNYKAIIVLAPDSIQVMQGNVTSPSQVLDWTTFYNKRKIKNSGKQEPFVSADLLITNDTNYDKFLPNNNIFYDMPRNSVMQIYSGSLTKDQSTFPFTAPALFTVFSTAYSFNAYYKAFIAMNTSGDMKFAFGEVNTPTTKLSWTPVITSLPDFTTNIPALHDIFLDVGCIGDSYTSGHMTSHTDPEEVIANQTTNNWPFFMAQDSGNTYHNYGVSGASAKSWLETSAYTEAQKHKCQCYLIGIGLNDMGEVGTIDDCENESADTYYRNMYVLLTKVHELNTAAPVFVMTAPPINTRAYMSTRNTAMKAIIDKYGSSLNAYILDLAEYTDKLYNAPYLLNNFYKDHYEVLGYKVLATNLGIVWDNFLANNYENFADVAFIPYDK